MTFAGLGSGPGRQLGAALVVAGSCVLTNAYYGGWGDWPAISFIYVIVAGVLGYRRLSQVGQRPGWLPSVVLAAFWLVSTGGIREHLGSGPTTLAAMGLAGAQMALVVRLAYKELWAWQPAPQPGSRRWLLLYAGLPLVYWASFLAAYFPARMTFDSFWQWGMAHHIKQYNDWHPFLHTALIELTSNIGDTPATYIVLQVVFAVSVIAYALWTLQSFGAPRWVTIALTLAYAAYPASAFFSVTMWKDVPFAYLVLLTTTMFAWVVRTRGDWLRRPLAVVALSLTCFATMHIRSNGLPAILLALVVAVVFLRPVRRRLALITGALVAAHLAWSGILLPRLHVLGPPATEALAIPTQQIGATYARAGVIAPEVGAYFNRILPAERWRAGYRTDITDPIKNNGLYRDEVIAESFPTYLANWARLLADNPSIFIRAFLDQTAALWQYTPSPPDARVYVGTSTELQDYSIHRRLLQRTSTAFPPFGTHADAIGLLYLEYNPHGCAPADQSCRPADRSDCFGEPACVTRTDFAIRTLASQRPLATSPLSQKLKAAYDTQYEHLSTDWQGPLARGAIPLFLLVLSIVIALRRQRLRALVFAPAIWVALSVAAAMPATDLRYAYGWIISIPFLLVLALLPTPDPDTSPADDLTTAHAPEATPATSGPGAPG